MLPAIAVFVLFGVYPMLDALWNSLNNYSLTSTEGKTFIGLQNYFTMFTDIRFWESLGRSLLFVTMSVLLSFLIGFGIALLLNRIQIFQGVFRIIFLVPMIIAPTITTLNFKFMYNYNLGILNSIFETIGLQKINFLGDSSLALLSTMIVDIWQWTPLVILVLLAGLEALPTEPYEAALIDGATPWKTFSFLTLPLLKKFIVIVLVIRVMDALKVYETIQLMTAGGPGTASETLNIYLAQVGFNWYNMGYASALGIFTLYFTTFIAWLLVKYTGAFKSQTEV
jgi:multiple sugar transport system permease protein